jgi:hypothetical protein
MFRTCEASNKNAQEVVMAPRIVMLATLTWPPATEQRRVASGQTSASITAE